MQPLNDQRHKVTSKSRQPLSEVQRDVLKQTSEQENKRPIQTSAKQSSKLENEDPTILKYLNVRKIQLEYLLKKSNESFLKRKHETEATQSTLLDLVLLERKRFMNILEEKNLKQDRLNEYNDNQKKVTHIILNF